MDIETRNNVKRIARNGVAAVFIAEPSARHYSDYSERPTRYMVQLTGENRKRRVYATPIGNVSVLYIKSKGERIGIESAIDAALHRNESE